MVTFHDARAAVMVPVVLCMLMVAIASADEPVDGSDKLERMIKSADLKYEKSEYFFIVSVKMPSRRTQKVFVTRKAQVFGDVPFVSITAIGWTWENTSAFGGDDANLLLLASSKTKIGAWQSLVFDDKRSLSAEFKATLPLTTTSKTLAAAIKAVASSANDLYTVMDR